MFQLTIIAFLSFILITPTLAVTDFDSINGGTTNPDPVPGMCSSAQYIVNDVANPPYTLDACSACSNLDFSNVNQYDEPTMNDELVDADKGELGAESVCFNGDSYLASDCEWRATCPGGYVLEFYDNITSARCKSCYEKYGAPYYNDPNHYNTYTVPYTNEENRICNKTNNLGCFYTPKLFTYHDAIHPSADITDSTKECPSASNFSELYYTYSKDDECSQCTGNTVVNIDRNGCTECAENFTSNDQHSLCLCKTSGFYLDIKRLSCLSCGENTTSKTNGINLLHNTLCECADGYYHNTGFDDNFIYTPSKSSAITCQAIPSVKYQCGTTSINAENGATFQPNTNFTTPSTDSQLFKDCQKAARYTISGWYPPLYNINGTLCTKQIPTQDTSATESGKDITSTDVNRALFCTAAGKTILVTPKLESKDIKYLYNLEDDSEIKTAETTTCDAGTLCPAADITDIAKSDTTIQNLVNDGYIFDDTWTLVDASGNTIDLDGNTTTAAVKYSVGEDITYSQEQVYLLTTLSKCPANHYCIGQEPIPCPFGTTSAKGSKSLNDCKTIAQTQKICNSTRKCFQLPAGISLYQN